MSSSLPLPHFIVRGFRCFEDLRIDGLGRVNLIVGKNSVGKTALLEAIEIYAAAGDPMTIIGQLSRREETFVSTDSLFLLPAADFSSLFRGHKSIEESGQLILAGIEMRMLSIQTDRISGDGHPMAAPAIVVGLKLSEQPYWFDVQYSSRIPNRHASEQLNHNLITSSMTRSSELADMWDKVDLTPGADDVLNAIRLIQPDIQGISFLGRGHGDRKKRVAHVRLSGSLTPVPLGSLGEGMSRVLALVLALVSAKDGVLLVDEFENGVHYSIQEKLWRFVLELATRLNVQVFATTHSWDCLNAFQTVNMNGDGKVIRLQNKNGRITPSLFDEDELEVVAREHLEIR